MANQQKYCCATAQSVKLLRPPYAPYLSCCLTSLLPLSNIIALFSGFESRSLKADSKQLWRKNVSNCISSNLPSGAGEKRNKKLIFSFATAPTIRNENNETQNKDVELPKKTVLCADGLEPDKLRWSVSEKLCPAMEANLCFYFEAAHSLSKTKV